MDKIADAASVSVRSVYNHFPTARHLIAGMYERGSDKIRPLMADLPAPDVEFGERVRRWVRLWGRIQEEIAPIRWRALIAETHTRSSSPSSMRCAAGTAGRSSGSSPRSRMDRRRPLRVAVTDSLTWRAMRRHQGLSVDQACNVLASAMPPARWSLTTGGSSDVPSSGDAGRPAVVARDLTKRYRDLEAVRSIVSTSRPKRASASSARTAPARRRRCA